MNTALDLLKRMLFYAQRRRRILFTIIGSAAGYAYYHYIGCFSGTCPITGNPWISTVYGALAGFLLSAPGKKQEKEE
jgi:hypothetical protein